MSKPKSWGDPIKRIPKRKWCPLLNQECGQLLCAWWLDSVCAVKYAPVIFSKIYNQLRFKEPQK